MNARSFLRFFGLFSDLLTVRNAILLGALAVIALTAAFGGWSAAADDTDETPEFEAADEIIATPFTVEVLEVFWAPEAGSLVYSGDSMFLLVRARIEVDNNEAVQEALLSKAVTGFLPEPLEPQPGLWSNSLADDGSIGTQVLTPEFREESGL